MVFRGNIGISTYSTSVAPLSSTIINLGKPEVLPDDYYYNSVGAPRVSHEQGIGEGLTIACGFVKVCSWLNKNRSHGGSKDATVQIKESDHQI